MICIETYKSPVGDVLLGSYKGKLCFADWKYRRKRITIDKRIQKGLKVGYVEESSEAEQELNYYEVFETINNQHS